jgi:hypothetical protein
MPTNRNGTQPLNRWFRFYNDALDDPKVQRLSGDAFKLWVNLLCMASKNNGVIVTCNVAFALRVTNENAELLVTEFLDAGLLDAIDGESVTPHNWGNRQYQSDNSAERVRRHRERRARDVTLHAPLQKRPRTDSEADADLRGLPEGRNLESSTRGLTLITGLAR